jgi:peptidyl-dipeptidase Dcp
MYVLRSALRPIVLAVFAILTACANPGTAPTMNIKAEPPTPLAPGNPLIRASTLPFQLPPFDQIRNTDIGTALEQGMAEQRKEINAIIRERNTITFANTVEALECSGQLLSRANAMFSNLTASNTNPELEDLQTVMAPKLAAHSDSIFLNPDLFARIESLHQRRAELGLDPESLRLLDRYYTLFIRAGAKLSTDDKNKLRGLNEQLSSLTTQFQQTVLKGVNAAAVVIEDVAELDGMTGTQMAVAEEAARARGLEDGKWLIPLLNTTTQPALSQLKNRAVRERIYQASIARGVGGEFDTTELISKITAARAERAALLGYANHAAYVLEDETALDANAVNKLLEQLVPSAVANAKAEADEIQKLIDAQAKQTKAKSFKLQPWDWDFYAEQVRAAKYSYDEAQVRPYFEMERVLRDGVLFAAQELYGVTFKERKDLPVYQSDVRVFEVSNSDNSPLGLFLVDWYARDNKRGGAWMNSFVEQSRLLRNRAVVVNNLNIPKPPEGQPTLLTFDEVTTAFHEFGHALHGLFSNVQYPQFSGTSVPRDFVEYPSQYNEMWATDPRILANYAKHYQTGEPMPAELMAKVLAASKFNQGYATTEYLAAALLDQAWHQLPVGKTPSAAEVAKFETTALKQAGVDFYAVPPRYRSTYFSHVFASPVGYSSGYYAYIWSEVLARDTEYWFKSNGGLKRQNGDLLRQKVLSKGFSADALTIFQDFYGRPPDIEPLLESRGLLAAGQ